MTQLVSVPLETLSLSRHNIRRTGRDTNIEQLAASILADGLLQNLTVARIPPQEDQPAERYEVIAGGRRLRALQLLDQRGDLPDLMRLVPVNVVSPDLANEVGLAENTIREGMHAHDEFVAFRDLANAGHGVEGIAQRFGVTPLVVERRLRLANVAPEILKAFSEDRVSLDVMMAFALTDDWKVQRRIFDEGTRNGRRLVADQVRRAIAQKEVPTSDKRVRFVTLGTYEAAGGAVRRDLFDDSGGGYVLDEALLDSITENKLQAEAQALLLQGWKFVHIERNGEPWKFRQGCTRTEPKRHRRELTPEESAELTQLKASLDALEVAATAADDASEFQLEPGDNADWDAYENARARIQELEQDVEVYSDRQKAKAGCLIELGYDGKLEVLAGLVPNEGSRTETAANKAIATAKGEKVQPKTPTLAEAMVRRLTAHRTLALQSALLSRRDIALKALAHGLLLDLLFAHGHEVRSALEVSAKNEHAALSSLHFQDVDDSPVMRKLDADIAELRATLDVPTHRAKFWPWLLQQSEDAVLALLGLAAVLSLDATASAPGEHPSDALAAALEVDYADYWQPTPEAFGNLVSKPLLLEALGECIKDETQRLNITSPLDGQGKTFVASEICRHLVTWRWLPKPLRRPGYAPGVPRAAAPEENIATLGRVVAARKATQKRAAPQAAAKKKPAVRKAPAKKSPPKKSAPKKRK
jgi:ParB family chromosome partitioning protein